MTAPQPLFPGTPDVINGNAAVAHVMKHVCGGVIGYPITPSTEISETFEAARAEGQLNVWGRHPFFVEAEGEHSGQSGALGAALAGGNFVSNASSSQGILYALESHYVTAGKKVGGFVLQVAARVVSKHSLNVMAGHDDVYALLPAGYTILFGSNPQEAADLAAIAFRVSSLSLIPVANTMDGFATSHVMSEVALPEPELLKRFLGDPAGRIPCPTVAQELLFGAKGRVFQLGQYLDRHASDFLPEDAAALRALLEANAAEVEADNAGEMLARTDAWVPEDLRAQWRRAWVNAWSKGTRQLAPALVDPHNPGLTGPVQNQPDFQAGAADHRTHFVAAVPALARQAMDEYAALTGRRYSPVQAYDCADADYIMVGLGSITDDVRAVLPYLRASGLKVGVVSIKLLQPFPEAELVAALGGAKAVTVLERSDDNALTRLVSQALFRARANAVAADQFPGVPPLADSPRLTTAIFGLGGHDVQPRHLVAAFKNMVSPTGSPLVYLGSQFFSENPAPTMAPVQQRLRAAYPETELMALTTEENPQLLPADALRIRFHSVGGYGTVATGKLLTDILAGVLGMHSKSAPKYGSEKSGAATNYYITLSPEPVLITNAELEDVEVVISPDHMVFSHTNPLKGLVAGGTFVLQSNLEPIDVWRALPAHARRTIRDKKVHLLVVDAFSVAKRHAPTADLETRMMGIAFIGAVAGHVDRITRGTDLDVILAKVRHELEKKFGRKGDAVVESNMSVIMDGVHATATVDYDAAEFLAVDAEPAVARARTVALSAAMCPAASQARPTALFDPAYYEELIARPFREGTISEAPVLPGTGLFIPSGTGVNKDKGIFRRTAPIFDPTGCTGCLECGIVCPDTAIPNTVHEIRDLLAAAIDAAGAPDAAREELRALAHDWSERIRQEYRADSAATSLAELAGKTMPQTRSRAIARHGAAVLAQLEAFPVARTRPFFDAMEKQTPGSGGLFSAVVDPWKCTGCLQCVDVCGPGSLTGADQDADLLRMLEDRFERLEALPNSPQRFIADAVAEDGDVKRIILDHVAYYAMVGGHGACRGCGEVTALHLVSALSKALGGERIGAHIAELTETIAALAAKRAEVAPADPARAERIEALIAELDKALYLAEGGPTGTGPASMVVANSTGCTSVYSSTLPFTPYLDPWVNGLFQDAQPLASGIFEGLVSELIGQVRALRAARLELADGYDPATHDKPASTITWQDFTHAELGLLPNVVTISGDGAAYDIGFGAMSRVLTRGTPIKMLVVDTGSYSNTGGQNSTASPIGQDADLTRFGAAHSGKREARKELGLIAAFHPNVFSCATSTALYGHFLDTTLRMLDFTSGSAVMQIYTPCGTENGVAEDLSARRSRLAVESRMAPVFVHDPSRGASLPERFNLDGNPDIGALWSATTIQYVDDSGALQLMQTPLTPADFARGEVRFAKHFHRLAADENTVPIADFVQLPEAERAGKIPFVYGTDADQRLIKIGCSPALVELVEDRKHNWQTMQFLAGVAEAALGAEHRAELAQLTARYEEATAARDASLDEIAAAMADLAASSAAPAALGGFSFGAPGASGAAPAASAPAAATAVADRPIWLATEDLPLCNDCGTCYQELPALFEKATIIVDGAAQVVGRMKDGALDGLEVTPELTKRFSRVKATCDAEIIK